MANPHNPILKMLRPGDLRMKGASEEVVARICTRPGEMAQLIDCLSESEPALLMRCCDALEKLSRQHIDWLRPYKNDLIKISQSNVQKEVRWHMAQIIPRLDLSTKQAAKAYDVFLIYLNDKSSIVKTFALQALTDLALSHDLHVIETRDMIKKLGKTGTPAMQSRSRKLLEQFN